MMRRTGLAIDRFYGNGHLFSGLNEAVTELMASNVRHELAESSDLVDEEWVDDLTRTWLHATHILFLQFLSLEAVGRDENRFAGIMVQMLRDYMLGTRSFLRRCARWRRGSVRILARMGELPEDAVDASRSLRMPEAEQAIRKVIKELG
jgi:hypothetical protein